MGDGHESTIRGGNPQYDVGEGEVGEKLPVTDQQVQPFDVFLTRASLGLHEFTKRRHALRLARGSGQPEPTAEAPPLRWRFRHEP